ncbi:toll/interleukin-1 receptor domain-containing protein [Spirosoma flavum]|uniref:Toll/interleukin-1 receptor domain-containing protein n=1 Tax=Spirosoma flavum TaxID=2048557 RepID=A0ABW6AQU7_9BACT
MKAWSIDANNIDLNDINTGQLNNYMVRTREINDFLSIETKKMFIVAPKGLGKTYLLKVKSQLYRDLNSGYKFIPTNSLCERFTNNDFSFSQKDLIKFNDISIWKKTWEVALYTLILASFKSDDLPKELKSIIGNAGSLAEILGTLLQQRSQIINIHNYVATDLKPAVRKLREESSTNQVAIFIDNIDEAFDNFVGYTAKSGINMSANIWINAQLSILFVAKDICAINRHVKIFLTIRSEAYNNNQDPQRLQLDDVSIILKYTKRQIQDIFHQNIILTPNEDLISPNNASLVGKLIGNDKITHKFVENIFGNKIEEPFFDFIYRHTYGRPREIVLMGKRIIEKIPYEDRNKSDIVGSVVNEVSYELFEQLKREVIPVFEDDVFEEFSKKVEHNIIRYAEAEKIYKEIKEEFNFNNVFSYFYRLGLVGIVDSVTDSKGGYQKQTFLPVGEYTLLDEKIPMGDYFVVHPTLNKKMKQIHDVGYYDKFNIIGYDNRFDPQIHQSLENHIHFGLDRDSLTIIFPELDHSKCIAVVVLPSPTWRDLENADTFILEVNATEYSYKVYRDDLLPQNKTEILDGWRNKRYSVILYTSEIEEISKFFKNVETITLCLYSTFIESLLKLLERENNKKRYIYYCLREFIDKDFARFKNNFDNHEIIIEPFIIDRYQYSQSLQYNSDERLLKCIISAEAYCRIICKDKPNSSLKNTSVIQKFTDENSFNYNIQVKNYINEGIYQFFKALRYHSIQNSGSIYENIIKLFSQIQISRIFLSIKNFDDDTFHAIFGGKSRLQIRDELNGLASDTLDRVISLFNKYNFSTNESNIANNKLKLIFPNDNDFYNYTSSQKFPEKENVEILYEIYKILEIEPNNRYRSLFISYSHKDSKIATIIEKKLSILGVEVKMFEKDNPHQPLIKYMIESVSDNERMLFLSSKYSLTSDGCHEELTTCRNLIRQYNDKSKLVAIRIDNYILETKEYEITDQNRIANFRMLKEFFINKYYDLSDSKEIVDMKTLNKYLDDLVKDALLVRH